MSTLIIDASSTTLFVGVCDSGAWIKLKSAKVNALEGLFDLAKDIFQEYPLASCKTIAFCEGPGRLMSLRVAAVAANQWATGKKTFVYNSLQAASIATGQTIGVELRQGAYAVWSSTINSATTCHMGQERHRAVAAHAPSEDGWQAGKIEVFPSLPETATLFSEGIQKSYMNALPGLLEKIARETSLFDPPLWAPIAYKKV
jgi:tRNA A37 threonylcarbamoyladenosine modification protein TsaB